MEKPSENKQTMVKVWLNNDTMHILKKVNEVNVKFLGGHDFLAVIANGNSSYFNIDNVVKFEVEDMENRESENE